MGTYERSTTLGLLLSLFFLDASASTQTTRPAGFRVERSALDCVVQYSNTYLAGTQNPIIVGPGRCPPRRNAYPQLPVSPRATEEGTGFTMTKSQIVCLAGDATYRERLIDPTDSRYYLIPINFAC